MASPPSVSRCEWCRVEKSSEIQYTPRNDATSGSELDTLSRVYAFILQKHQERKQAAPTSRREDAEGESNGIRAKPRIP